MKSYFISCLVLAFSVLSAQKADRDLSSFTSVSTSSAIAVTLVPSTKNRVELSFSNIDENEIITEVKDNRLKIGLKSNTWGNKRKNSSVSATVYYTQNLEGLNASSAGTITAMEARLGQELKLNASSAGKISVEGDSPTVAATASSAGTISLKGKGKTISANASSSGTIKAGDFTCDDGKAVASSAGSISLWADAQINANASSGGTIIYNGDPKNVQVSKSSGGNVKKK